jgi:hypothetical protein
VGRCDQRWLEEDVATTSMSESRTKAALATCFHLPLLVRKCGERKGSMKTEKYGI